MPSEHFKNVPVDMDVRLVINSRIVTIEKLFRKALGLQDPRAPGSVWLAVTPDVYDMIKDIQKQNSFKNINMALRYILGVPRDSIVQSSGGFYFYGMPTMTGISVDTEVSEYLSGQLVSAGDVIRMALGLPKAPSYHGRRQRIGKHGMHVLSVSLQVRQALLKVRRDNIFKSDNAAARYILGLPYIQVTTWEMGKGE